MKKSLLFTLLAACLLLSGQLFAQDFGVRVGLNSTNATIDVGDIEVNTDGQTNLALGVFLNLPVGTEVFSIQPELTYLNRGYKLGESLGVNIGSDVSIAYFDLGALARLNFGADEPLGFYIGAGPYFSYALSGTVEIAGDETDIDFDTDEYNRSELQVAGAAGITINAGLKFFGEVRYMGSLSNQSSVDNVDIRQRALGVHVGIMVPIGG